eukprot:TRINITY_DN70625_c0_g1_i1.p1 TRINITY_DN70625_c0_g1~~TRINITY_DN70625_c0_g1_i1.p1  ORF type:complete len:238 (+),score=59.02 TRINITY_DN70625_c0_g1_i1:131-844(+)
MQPPVIHPVQRLPAADAERDAATALAREQAAALVFHRRWHFWVHRGQGPHPEHVLPIATARNAAQFWAAYTHLQHPSNVPVGTVYLLLAEGVPPYVGQLSGGGRWVLRLHKGDAASCVWEDMLLRCVGEQWDPPLEVLGIAVSVMNDSDAIELWCRSPWCEATQQLQRQLISLPPQPSRIAVEWEAFQQNDPFSGHFGNQYQDGAAGGYAHYYGNVEHSWLAQQQGLGQGPAAAQEG